MKDFDDLKPAALEIVGTVKIPERQRGIFYVKPLLPNPVTDQDIKVHISLIYRTYGDGDIVRCSIERKGLQYWAKSIIPVSVAAKLDLR